MNTAWNKIRQFWNEHPLETIAIGITATIAAAKLMEANTNRKNSQTYRLEVERRRNKQRYPFS